MAHELKIIESYFNFGVVVLFLGNRSAQKSGPLQDLLF